MKDEHHGGNRNAIPERLRCGHVAQLRDDSRAHADSAGALLEREEPAFHIYSFVMY